ncbi:MAG TPA: 3-oxoadipate enol-lactonase [Jatrophihabitantaceae bacterium]|nr:3-oxoadipate enol-lactonase [Jatrophihabitantaceae bacterium]
MTLRWRIDGAPDAPVLVLLNSVGSTTDMWAPVVGSLAEQFRVVRIDHRGHGDSPLSPAGTECTLADLSADVIEVLDELGLDRVYLAGLSLGGMTGMWLAIHHPDRIKRLALLCTSAAMVSDTYAERAQMVRTEGMRAAVDRIVGRWLTVGTAERDPDLVVALRAMVLSIDAESYAQCCEAIAAMDLRADLGRIAAPTIVIAGRQDSATPPEHGALIANGIPGARLELLDNAAHLATLEQPGRIGMLLLEHFRAGATLERGYSTRRAVLGDEHVDRTIASTTALTEPFQEFITRYAWGDVWSRPELALRERSIATLAALVALGAEHELAMHVRAARRNGLTPEDIVEVFLHTALYAGLPRANRAITIAREVLTSSDQLNHPSP